MGIQPTGLRARPKTTVKADDKGINWRSCENRKMPTLNPNLNLQQNIYKGRDKYYDRILIARLEGGVSELYYPGTRTLVADYHSKDQKDPIKRQRLFLNNQSLETELPDQLKKKELFSTEGKPIYYTHYDKDAAKEETFYKVYHKDYATQVVDTTKNTKKEFNNAEGKVIVYKDGKEIKTLPKEEPNITRAVQYDGTQVKEVKLDGLEEKLRITKKLGPQTKTAEVIMADGQIKPLFRKSYKTGEREINPDLSRFLPKDLKTKILSPKQKFLKVAKDLIKWLKQDGTQVKEVKLDGLEEKLRITKKLGPQTKTAEVIMADGQIKTLFRKSYKTGEREINPDLSKLLPQEALEDILSQKQKFSETAKKLIKWLKEYKLLK